MVSVQGQGRSVLPGYWVLGRVLSARTADPDYMGTEGSKYTRVRSLGGDEAMEQGLEPSGTEIPGQGTLTLLPLGMTSS